MGKPGSHHSEMSADVVRRLVLTDDVASFMMVNDQDAKAAWSFTALCELAHIWRRQTGISGEFHEQRAEKFSNDVASRVLLADNEFDSPAPAGADLAALVSQFAQSRHLRRPLVAYRATPTSDYFHTRNG